MLEREQHNKGHSYPDTHFTYRAKVKIYLSKIYLFYKYIRIQIRHSKHEVSMEAVSLWIETQHYEIFNAGDSSENEQIDMVLL